MTATVLTIDTVIGLGDPPALNPAHVRWRVDSEPSTRDGKTTARFVPYVTMEHLAGMLDTWVGPARWRAEFDPADKTMWCRITILVPTNSVFFEVTKTDVGDFEDSAKAAVSDAFKRCASRMWGVGREVRSLPTVWAPCRTYESHGKTYAVANNDTVPTIGRKLAKLGHAGFGTEADGTELLDPDDVGEAQTAPPLNPNDTDTQARFEALDTLGNQVEQLDDTSRRGWAEWKVANHGWQKTIDGVHDAADTVDHLLNTQADTQIAAGPAIPQPVPAAPSEEAGDEPF